MRDYIVFYRKGKTKNPSFSSSCNNQLLYALSGCISVDRRYAVNEADSCAVQLTRLNFQQILVIGFWFSFAISANQPEASNR
jgi:hypothetical protein